MILSLVRVISECVEHISLAIFGIHQLTATKNNEMVSGVSLSNSLQENI